MTTCPHCGSELAKGDGQRLKLPTTCVILHKGGEVEINCRHCKNGVLLPLQFKQGEALRKGSINPRFVLRKKA